MAHCVIRTDRMAGTDVASYLVSCRYKTVNASSQTVDADIDNGNVVKLSTLLTGEREVYKAEKPAANTALKDLAVIATPEVNYCVCEKGIENFYNKAGKICRAYRLHEHDMFGVTAEGLVATDISAVAVGDLVEVAADTKLHVVSSLTQGSTQVGVIEAIEQAGQFKYYVIRVI